MNLPSLDPSARPAAAPARGVALAAELLLLTLVEALACLVGLMMPMSEAYASPYWPATGIAIAWLFRRGIHLWPAVAVGAAIGSVMDSAPLSSLIISALANTLEAIIAAVLLHRFITGRRVLDAPRHVLMFIGIGVCLAPLVSGTCGALGSLLQSREDSFLMAMMTWTSGGAMGSLTIAPLMLAWSMSPERPLRPRESWERWIALALLVAAILLSWWPFPSVPPFMRWPLSFLPFPFLVWIAFRLRQRVAVMGIALLTASVIATGVTHQAAPPLPTGRLESMLLLHCYLASAAITVLLISAIVYTRDRSESQLALRGAALEAATDGLIIIDRRRDDHPMIYVSPAVAHLVGSSHLDLIGQPLAQLRRMVSGDDRYGRILDAVSRGRSAAIELALHRPRENAVPVLARVQPVYDRRGRASQCVLTLTDVSDVQRANAALSEQGALFRQMTEAISEVFWLVDWAGNRILYVSPGYESIWGRPREGLYTDRTLWAEPIHPEDRSMVLDGYEERIESDTYDVEYRIVRPDGRVRWVHDRGTALRDADGRIARIAGVARDITDRKLAELEVRERESRYRAAIDGSLDAFFLFRSVREDDGRVVDFEFTDLNSNGERLLNRQRDAIIGHRLTEVVPENGRDGSIARYAEVMATGTPLVEEFKVRSPGVHAEWVHHQVVAVEDGIAIISRDISDSRRAQQALADSEQRYETILETIEDVITVHEMDGRFIFASSSHEKQTGYRMNELLGRDAYEFIHPDDRAAVANSHQRLAAGESGLVQWRRRNRDGSYTWVETSTDLVRDDAGQPSQIICATRDISERKRAEQRQLLIMRELDHRVKNNLAAVLAIAQQSMAHAESLEAFDRAFTGRLQALARTHEAMAASRWRGVRLDEVVRLTLEPHQSFDGASNGGARLTVRGEDLLLPMGASAAIAMSLHELSTNAAKYGALSTPGGRVEVHWTRDGDRLRIGWTESDGPPVVEPQRHGFGLMLIRGMIEHELQGTVKLDFNPQGLRCELDFPLEDHAANDDALAASIPAPIGSPVLPVIE